MSLTAFLASYQPRPFDWSAANCCHFAAAWVEAKTGKNPMRGLDGTPGRFAAWRLTQRLGGSLGAAWTRQLEQAPIPATFAQVGDVVLFEKRNAVAICAGGTACFVEAGGAFAFLPMREADFAWRVE